MYLRDNKFVISCPARSGSTMLLHLLRSNPQVMCHGEVFGRDGLGHIAGDYAARRREDPAATGQLSAYRERSPAAFLYDIVFDAQGRRVVGFKFKTDEAFDERFADIQEIIRGDADIKIVQLRRRNVVDQFISHQVVLHQTGVTWIGDGDERPEVQPFDVDVREAVAYVLDVIQREEAVGRVYAGHRRILVDYEDVVDPAHPVRGELQAFLGIDPQALSTPTRKILKRNDALVRNVEDVRGALRLMGLGDRC
jgi:LPS sulfotransferase NodH